MGGYRRILLKLSGQSLAGPTAYGIHAPTMAAVAQEISEARRAGHEIAIVIGGGNIFRGVSGAAEGMDRAAADGVGMLATIMNCIALQTALEAQGTPTRLYSSVAVGGVAELFSRRRALEDLAEGRTLLLAGGTGNPFFTTDSAAALRAAELNADAVLKATRVDGVYDRDPEKDADAVRFEQLTYARVLAEDLKVMDTAAFAICRDSAIPIVVFNLHPAGNIVRAAEGEAIGTLVADASRLDAPTS